jgi:anti-anti-sigma factor
MEYFTIERLGDVVVVRFVFNEISLQEKHIISEELSKQLGESSRIVLNLNKIGFLSSSFISLLVHISREIVEKKNGSLRLCCLSPESKAVLKLTRLDNILNTFDTEEDAVKSLQ